MSDMVQSDSRDQTPAGVPVAPVAPIVVLPTSSTPSPGAATSSPSPPTRYRKYLFLKYPRSRVEEGVGLG